MTLRDNKGAALRCALLATACLTMAGWGTTAAAQADTGENEKQDSAVDGNVIVVTGRLRNENLQDVPASVTVLGEQQLTRAGVREVKDFVELTPNVSFQQSQNAGTSALVIRGVSQIRNVDAPAAIVIDGVQTIDPNQFNQALFDIESIEVFRGPQGAYWGRNAIAGAINITTHQPSDDLEARLTSRYQSGDDIWVSGLVSGPLVEDKAYFKLAAFYNDRKGRIDTTAFDNADFVKQYGVRGSLIFNATPELTIELRGAYQDFEGGALYWAKVDPTVAPDSVLNTKSTVDLPGRDDKTLGEASLKLEYESDKFTITAISAYTNFKETVFGDADFGTAPVGARDVRQMLGRDVEAFSQEVRLTSSDTGRFRWQLGAYYLTTDRSEILDVAGDFDKDGIFETPFVAGNDLFDQESWAVYGNVQFDITDQLTLAAALRYDNDKFTVVPANGVLPPRELKSNALQPRIDLTYEASDAVSLYASYAEGFRSGRLNANTVPANLRVAQPEEATTYELGFKSQFSDYDITFNGAIFYSDYKNALYFQASRTFGQLALNIEQTDLWGAEFSFSGRPTDNLQISAAFGYTDGEIKAFNSALAPGVVIIDPTTIAGKKPPLFHDFTLNLGADYTIPLKDGLDFIFSANHEVLGKREASITNNYATGSYNKTGVRASLEADNWAVTAFGKNIFNTKYTDEYFVSVEQSPNPFNIIWPNEGSIWGVEFRLTY